MDENGACPGCSGLPECGGCVHSTGGADVSDNRFDRLLSDCSGQNTVDISLSSNGDTTGTDGKIYLFELRPYESEIGSRTDYVSSVGAGETRTVSIPLNKGTAQDRLYSRFVPAVFDGTAFTAVGAAHYITNPEVVASNQDGV